MTSAVWCEGTKIDQPIDEFEQGATFNARCDQFDFFVWWTDGIGNDFSFNDLTAIRDTAYNLTSGFLSLNNSNIVDDVQNMVNGTYGFASYCAYTTSSTATVHSTESTTSSNAYRPIFVITYTEAAAGEDTRRRNIIVGDDVI